jgi:photosystem II stability/assembly factor-like uncharacterized protein
VAEWSRWREDAVIDLATPILAVTGDDQLIAAGVGSLVRLSTDSVGPVERTPLTSLAALCLANGWLIAGGADGIVRRRWNPDEAGAVDSAWERAEIRGGRSPVSAIVAMPGEEILLAGTLTTGILRSRDHGRSWMPANFGFTSLEVTALAISPNGTVFAGTTSGLFLSRNDGQAWRRCPDIAERAIEAVACTSGGTVLAVLEGGGTFSSSDDGADWRVGGQAPADTTCLLAGPDRALTLGTALSGIWRSTDGGLSWSRAAAQPRTIYCLGSSGARVFAGTDRGLSINENAGADWTSPKLPPTHDLDRLLALDGRLVATGLQTGAVLVEPDGAWEPMRGAPFPLICAAATPHHALLGAGPTGLFRLMPGAEHPEALLAPDAEQVGQLAMRPDGVGWAAPRHHGDHILRTTDGGTNWETVKAPFGALPLTALAPTETGLIAARFDERHRVAELWRSSDEGETWQHALRAETAWPVIAILATPELVGLGRMLFGRDTTGRWTRRHAFDGGIRAVTCGSFGATVLTSDGLWASTDGVRWEPIDDAPPAPECLDVCASGGRLYALLTGGRIWSSRPR